jgi:hypothetical protein
MIRVPERHDRPGIRSGETAWEYVHNAWVIWMQETDPGHHAIRPYEALDSAAQVSDEPFVAAIKLAVGRVSERPA